MVQGQVSIIWLAWGALKQPLVEVQGMQAFEIEGQTHQTPFSGSGPQAAQRELTESQDLLDDPDHGFNGALAQTIDGLTNLRLQFVSHLFFGTDRKSTRLNSSHGYISYPLFSFKK